MLDALRFTQAKATLQKFRKVAPTNHLQRGVGVGDEGDEVLLEPGSGLWCGLQRVGLRATRVVARGRGVARAVAFSSGFHPDDRIDQRRAGIGRWASTKASTLDLT